MKTFPLRFIPIFSGPGHALVRVIFQQIYPGGHYLVSYLNRGGVQDRDVCLLVQRSHAPFSKPESLTKNR